MFCRVKEGGQFLPLLHQFLQRFNNADFDDNPQLLGRLKINFPWCPWVINSDLWSDRIVKAWVRVSDSGSLGKMERLNITFCRGRVYYLRTSCDIMV